MAIARGLFSGGYRKLLLLTIALFGALWLLGPSDRRKGVVDYVENKGSKVLDDYGYGRQNHLLQSIRVKPQLHQDPLQTTRCDRETQDTNAKDRNGLRRPLVQYAVMIDAGSTGSRVHVYKFNFCSAAPELEDEYFEMLQGGLSSYENDPQAAASSLRPLLNSALKRIPKSLQSCSPIQVKATAGLRMIGPTKSESILKEVRRMLEKEYPFPIADGLDSKSDTAAIQGLKENAKLRKGIEIMEGRDEGVFAWITVNYLLNRIGSSQNGGKKQQTAAVMDLGGGSTQIVFEPIFKSGDQGMREGEHVYKLENFGSSSYTLYQNSYLGYGLMQARKSIEALTAFAYSISNPEAVRTGIQPPEVAGGYAKGTKIPSPCFAEGKTKNVKINQVGTVNKEIEVVFEGTSGGFEACRRFTEVMMNKDAVCLSGQCSFAGVYQPSLMKTFAQSPIVALSFFYDRLEPLGFTSSFTISQLASLAKEVCSDPKLWSTKFPKEKYPHAMELLEDKPELCLDLTFMHGLLSLGYELDGSRTITVAKKLGGTELGWCVGATLALLEESGNICKR